MQSYKEFLAEARAPTTPAPAPSGDPLDVLQQGIIALITDSINALRRDLKARDTLGNPFDLMRRSLPWHRRLRNWWGRFWNNDTTVECRDFGLEFPDFVPLHEQEAYNELAMIVEGPVTQAITLLDLRLAHLQSSMIAEVRRLFSSLKVGRNRPATATADDGRGVPGGGLPPGGDAREEPPIPAPGPPDPAGETPPPDKPENTGEPSPEDQKPPGESPDSPSDQDDLGDDEEPPPDSPSDQDDLGDDEEPLPEEPPDPKPRKRKSTEPISVEGLKVVDLPVNVLKTQMYGVVQKVEVDGKRYTVSWAKYDPLGVLAQIMVTGIDDRIINVPEEMGRQYAIRFAAREGTVKQIIQDIGEGKPSPPRAGIGTSATILGPRPRTSHKFNPLRHPVDHTRELTPEEDKEGGEGEGDEEESDEEAIARQIADESPDLPEETARKLTAKTIRSKEKLKKRLEGNQARKNLPGAQEVAEYIKGHEEYINPKLTSVLRGFEQDPKAYDSVTNFLHRMGDEVRPLFLGKMSDVLDTPDTDLGKLDWVAKLDPETAGKAGARLSTEAARPDGDEGIVRLFADEPTFSAWARSIGTNESRLWRSARFLEDLRSRSLIRRGDRTSPSPHGRTA